jgi:hypothetical protein
VSGVSINAYWLSTAVWDVLVYQVPLWSTILILYARSVDKLAGHEDVLGATILLFLFHGTAAAGFTYVLTYLFKSPASAQNVMIFINVRCGLLAGWDWGVWTSAHLVARVVLFYR